MIKIVTIANWYSGNHGGLTLPDICLTGEEKPQGSILGPLRDRRARYRLLHSGGPTSII